MTTDARPEPPPAKDADQDTKAGKRLLTPQAERALAEAAARRAAEAAKPADAPKEVGGRGGLDPTRYGDWENKGLASDF